MKHFKIYLLFILLLTLLFLMMGMFQEISTYYSEGRLSELIGPRVRHLNSNLYTGFYLMSVLLTTLLYLVLVGLMLARRLINRNRV